MNNLIDRIDEFEQELQTLAQLNREMNFMEQYTDRIRHEIHIHSPF
jgi:hypothetical protein